MRIDGGFFINDFINKNLRQYTIPVYQRNYLRKWWPDIVFLRGTDPEYINQIMDYTFEAEHDDAPDSAAVCCKILDNRWWA